MMSEEQILNERHNSAKRIARALGIAYHEHRKELRNLLNYCTEEGLLSDVKDLVLTIQEVK